MLTFTEEEMAIIIQGLGMLPANQSYKQIRKIEDASQPKSENPDLENK